MKIIEMRMQNFRCFEDKTIEFNEGFNVLVGGNGSGKTAILDALAVGIGTVFYGLDGETPKTMNRDDVKISESDLNSDLFKYNYPSSLFFRNNYIAWERSINTSKGRTTRKKAFELIEYANKMQRQINLDNRFSLPCISYYGTGRLWGKIRGGATFKKEKPNRNQGYNNCLNPRSDDRNMVAWYKRMDYKSVKEDSIIGSLEAVKKSIIYCIPNCKSIDYSIDREELVVQLNDDFKLPFSFLSDGYRNMLAMVADVAYRCAVLNPHLGEEAPLKTSGMVLIDEIDLHLHPRWQLTVVDSLKRAFPNIQFVVTTHSPFIIQSLKRDEIINLDDINMPNRVDKSIEEIVEEVQGIELPQLHPKRKEMIETAKMYYTLLKQGEKADEKEKEKIKHKLDDLMVIYSDDSAFYSFLQMERIAAGLDGDGKK